VLEEWETVPACAATTGVPAGEIKSIPWCVCPTLGHPNESTNEFSPATGQTCSAPPPGRVRRLAEDRELLGGRLLPPVLRGQVGDPIGDHAELLVDRLLDAGEVLGDTGPGPLRHQNGGSRPQGETRYPAPEAFGSITSEPISCFQSAL
jgi:hypothetical protein